MILHAPEEAAARAWQRRILERNLDRLTPRQREVVTLAWGLDGRGAARLSEIAADLGVSLERVRQIRDTAVRRLRRAPQVFAARHADGLRLPDRWSRRIYYLCRAGHG